MSVGWAAGERVEAGNLYWQAGTNSNWSTNAADVNWSGAGTTFVNGADVVFDDSVGAGSRNVTVVGTVTPTSLVVTGSGDYTFVGGGVIGGAIGLVKSGTGTLTISNTGANAYYHGTSINGGTVRISGPAASTALGTHTLTINAGTLQISTDGIVSTRGITLGNVSSAVAVDAGMTYTQAFRFEGSGNLNVTGAGTLVLADNNTFTGQTIIQSGTVKVGVMNAAVGAPQPLGRNANPVIIGSSTAFNVSKATLDYTGATATNALPIALGSGGGAIKVSSSSATLRLNGAISGNGDLNVFGPGTLHLQGANTFTGQTIVHSGTVFVNTAAALGTHPNPLVIGTGTPFETTGATLRYGTVSQTTSLPIILGAGGGGIHLTNSSMNITLTSPVTGGSLWVEGPGRLTLASTSNSYTGPTTVNGVLSVTGAIGSLVTVNNGGQLKGTGNINALVTVNPGGTISPRTALQGVATLTLNAGLVVNGGSYYYHFGAGGASDKVQVNGTATLSGNQTLNIDLQDGVTVGDYTLISTTGGISSSATFSVVGPGGLGYIVAPDVTGKLLNLHVETLNLSWRGTTNSNWSQNTADANWAGIYSYYQDTAHVTFDDSVDAGSRNINVVGIVKPGSITVGGNGDYTIGGAGLIDDATSITKTGPGTLTFTNTNNYYYWGGMNINGGTVRLNGSGVTLPDAGLVINAGTLRVSVSGSYARSWAVGGATAAISVDAGQTFTLSNRISGAGNLNATGMGTLILSAAENTFTGTTIVQSGTVRFTSFAQLGANPSGNRWEIGGAASFSTSNATLMYAGTTISSSSKGATGPGGGAIKVSTASTTLTLSGIISGSGDLHVQGPGTLVLSGANTLSGRVFIDDGELRVATMSAAVGAAQPLGTNANPLVIGSNTAFATTNATLTYTGASATSLLPVSLGTGGGAIKVNSAAANLTIAGAISGGALIVTGPGVLTLSGASTYSGTTTVNAAFVVNGSLGNTAVTVNASGRLSGGGAIGGTVGINSGGIVSPHTSSTTTATLSTGNLTANSGAVFNINLASPVTSDALAVTGTATLTGTQNFNFTGVAGFAAGNYTLISTSAGVTSTATYAVTGPLGYFYVIAPDVTGNLLNMNVVDFDLSWRGTTNSNWSKSAADANWQGPTNHFADGARVFFDDSVGAGPRNVSIVGTVTPFGVDAGGAGNYTFSGTGLIAGATSIVKSDAGTLTISNTGGNTYTGGVTINGGAVRISGTAAASALGAANSTVTINNGTLQIGAGGVTSTHPITLGDPNAAIAVDSVITYTQNGVVGGTGNLNATGAGTLVLGGVNTFTGRTLIQSGTVQVATMNIAAGTAQPLGKNANPVMIGAGAAFAATNATLAYSGLSATSTLPIELGFGGGAVKVTNTGSGLTLNGVVSGSGNLYVTGPGFLTLDAANTFSGQTIVLAGRLTVASLDTAGQAQPLGTNANPLVIGSDIPYAASNATFRYTGPATTSDLPIVMGSGGGAIYVAADVTLTAGITGGGIVVSGSGVLTLAGVNTYTGTTVISLSVLNVTGSLGNTTVDAGYGGVLGGTGTIGGPVIVGGVLRPRLGAAPSILTLNNTLNFNSGALLDMTLGAAGDLVQVNSTAGLSGFVAINISADTGFGVGDYTLINTSGGVTSSAIFSVTGPSGYAFIAAPDVTGTKLNLHVENAPYIFWRGNTNSNWSTSQSDANWDGVHAFYPDGAHVIFDDTVGAGSRSVNIPFVVTPSSITVGGAGDYTFGGPGYIAGGTSIVKNGPGVLSLATTSNNTFTGGVTINEGVLRINGYYYALGDASSPVAINNGTLQISSQTTSSVHPVTLGDANAAIAVDSGLTYTQNGLVGGSGNLNATGAGTLVLTAANTFTGQTKIHSGTVQVAALYLPVGSAQPLGKNANPVVIGGSTAFNTSNATLVYTGLSATSTLPIALGSGGGAIRMTNGTPTLTLNGLISGAGELNFLGSGTLILTGNNTFSGQTFIRAGNVQVAAMNVVGMAQPLGTSQLSIGTSVPFATSNATLTYTGPTTTSDFPITIGNGGGAINVTSAATNLTLSGVISGGGLRLPGPGTVTLTGANTYTGATTVSGVLNVLGSLGNTAVTVQSGAVLGGGGTIGGPVSMTSGTIKPRTGAVAATLTINNSLTSTDTTLAMTLGAASDLIQVNGSAALLGDTRLSMTLEAGLTSGNHPILVTTGGISGATHLTLLNLPPGFAYNLAVDPTGKMLVLQTTAQNLTWLGTKNSQWSYDASDTNWTGTSTYYLNLSNVVFDDSVGSGSRNIVLAGGFTSGVTVGGNGNYTFGGIGSLASTSYIIKNGPGMLTLAHTGASTLNGGITINGGTIRISGAAAASQLGASQSPVTINNGTLQVSSSGILSSHPVTVGDPNAAIKVDSGLTYTQAGNVGGSGNLNATGVGTLILSGSNTFAGQTIIQSGTVQIPSIASAGAAQPLGTNANPVVVGTSTAFATTGASLAYSGGSTTSLLPVAIGSGGGAIAVTTTGTNLTLAGPVTGGILTTKGPGMLTLSVSPKTYAGGTNVLSGTLVVDSSSALGAGLVSVSAGAVLRLTNSTLGAAVSMPTLSSQYVASSSWSNGSQDPASVATGAPPFWQAGANAGVGPQPDFIMVDLGATYKLNNVTVNWNEQISNPQAFAFYVAPDGASNLYTSPLNDNNPTVVEGGATNPNTLTIANWTLDSVLFTSAAPTTGTYIYTLNGVAGRYFALRATTRGPSSYAMRISQISLHLAGAATQTISSLSGAAGSTVEIAANLTLNVGSDHSSTTFAGAITGNGTLSKIGAGTLTLTGSNTYGGGTVVQGGVLLAQNDNAFGSANGPISLDGGTLAIFHPTAGTPVTMTTQRRLQVTSDGGVIRTANAALTSVAAVTFTGTGGYDWGSDAAHPLVVDGPAGTVTLNGGTGSVRVAAGGAISITPAGTLNIGGSTDPLTDNTGTATHGNHVAILNEGIFTIKGNTTVAALSGGTLTGTASAVSATGITYIPGNAQLGVSFIRQHTLAIGDATSTTGARVTVAESSPGLGTGIPSGDDANVSVVRNLNIASSEGVFVGTLDLTNNDLIVDYTGETSPFDYIEDLVRVGFNSGNWNGKGITSSVAAADNRFSLAVIDNAQATVPFDTFNGIDTSNHQQVIVKFTWVADLNLDGVVTSSDAITFAAFYQQGQPATHRTGDLNYNGIYDVDDAVLFAAFYDQSLPHLPEPASIGMLAFGALGLLKRRR